MTILCIFLISLAFVSNTLALPLEGEYEEVTIAVADSFADVDFFFEKSGSPQGGIILTHAEPNSQLANNLAHVLSQYGWSVAIIDLSDQFILPARTRFPQKSIRKQIPETEAAGIESKPSGDIAGAEDTSIKPNPPGDIIEAEDAAIEPNLPGDIIAAEDATIEPNPAGDIPDAGPPPLVRTSAAEKLSAIINFMETEKGLLNLVFLSINDSFDHLNQYFLDDVKKLTNVHAVILLDVNQTKAINELPKALSILDIDTSLRPSSAFSARRISSQRFRLTRYYQVHMPFVLQQQEFGEDRLTKRIRGWLAVYVKGMEVRRGAGQR